MLVLYPGRIGVWSSGFCEKKKKTEKPAEKPSE